MPRVEQTVTIAAPLAVVWKVARDVEAFPSFMDDLQSLTVLERSEDGSRTVTSWVGVIREFKMTVKWTQEDVWNEAAGTDDFRMLSGDMDSMSGRWTFTSESAAATRFDSVMDYEFNVPLIGAMVKALIHSKMTSNLASTMAAIKSRAESAT